MTWCEKCSYKNIDGADMPCLICTVKDGTVPTQFKDITNGNRIRAMSDEELAEWLSDMHDTVTCPNS